MPSPTRIVILGGGFGGMYAALEFEKALRRDQDLEVTLVNRENYFLFTPMLHEVAASDLDVTHIVNPIRKLLRRVQFVEGEVARVDLERRAVTVAHGRDGHPHELPFDHLVLALGSVTNFFGMADLEEHAVTMKSLGDAIHLRNRLISSLEQADPPCLADERRGLLTCVVAGGGFAGVETIAGINDFLREAIEFYPNLAARDLRLVLVHPGSTILPELGPELGRYAQTKLARRGVEIRVEAKVTGFDGERVRLDDGTSIPARTLIWTAGTSVHPLAATLDLPMERGRLVVDTYLRVPGREGIWALGDCARVPDRRTAGPCPPTAQHAVRQGRTLARNVLAATRDGRMQPFDFRTLGQLAAIGRRTGVARIMGVQFSGPLAWFLWRTIYLSKLPRFEKKLRVALDWTLDLLFRKDLVQFETHRAPRVSHADEAVPVVSAAVNG